MISETPSQQLLQVKITKVFSGQFSQAHPFFPGSERGVPLVLVDELDLHLPGGRWRFRVVFCPG